MEKLNVMCSACNKGKLVTLDLLHDDYKMGCDTCDHTFWTHYTGFDSLMEEHEYNENVGVDVQILNANGTWSRNAGDRFEGKDFNLEEFTKDMTHIQSIKTYEEDHYYRKGASFINISQNHIHDTFSIYKYTANDNCMTNLLNHFFGIKA